MYVEQEVSSRCPRTCSKVRAKQLRGSRGRSKTRTRGSRSKAHHVHRRSLPEHKKAQVREKEVWKPWKGLIVIGKRVELLDRNLQKSKLWDTKLESEDWKPEDEGKKSSKERSGLHQERVDTKLLNSAGRTVQASAVLEPGSSEKIWRPGDSKVRAVSRSAEMTAEPEEKLKDKFKDRLRTTRGDLRSRGDQLGQIEESSEENLMYKKEKRGSTGEKVVGRGEKRRSVVEKVDSRERQGYSGEKRRSVVEKVDSRERQGYSGEKRRSVVEKVDSRERPGHSGERRRSVIEKVDSRERPGHSGERRRSIVAKMDSRERRGSVREKALDIRERRGSIREKALDSGERRGVVREKASDSGERRGSTREKVKSNDEKQKLSREKLRSSGEKLRTGDISTGDNLESNIGELESDEMKLETHSRTEIATEEDTEKVIQITGDESVIENTSQEMQIHDSRDEQGGAEEEMGIDSSAGDEMKDTAD
ncbi:titin homolog [Psammomys obesus]|uniref:titin homolog n=1 Tax=Psammomys obesus TaxID=48139 RepID=UPI002452FBF9|nr:titin homolog [Psammomys obesus]